MSPNNWGPPIWTLFHTIAEKIKDDKFKEILPSLFIFLKRICSVLPCPDCSQHATQFLNKVNSQGIRDKNDLKNILYIFHNSVNRRKQKSSFNIDLLPNYSNNNLINTYNNFVAVFHTKGNMKLLAETFQRKLVLNDFKNWFIANIQSFAL